GRTGRNIAAGMSGGIAFFLDLDQSEVNSEMVDLEPLTAEDREFLRDIVSRHLSETGSAVAGQLVSDWGVLVTRFSKIMPRDYKRVLEAAKAAEDAGRNVDEAIMAAAHG